MAQAVYEGGGKICDVLVAPHEGLLTKRELLALRSHIFGALMDAYNTGIAHGVEAERRRVEQPPPPTPQVETGATYFPDPNSKDEDGTIRFPVRRYVSFEGGGHASGKGEIKSAPGGADYEFWDWVISHPPDDYDFWYWFPNRPETAVPYRVLDLAGVAELRARFADLKASLSHA